MTFDRELLTKSIPVIVLFALCLAISLVDRQFASVGNVVRIAAAAAIPLILALGVTFIILMGSIDLSIEGALSFSAAAVCTLVANAAGLGFPLGLASVPLIIAIAALFGAVVGSAHVFLRVPSFMASLGMGFVGVGIATLYLGGERVQVTDQAFRALTLGRFAGLPYSVYIALVMLAIAWFVQEHTRLGRHIMALGGGEDLAHASGIDTRRVRLMAFALAGAFYGVAAILLTAKLGFGSALIGNGQLFTAVSAVVVGGTALTGGKGGPFNTLVGVLIVTVLNNGMIVLGLPSFIQQGVLGVVIIAAVLVSSSGRLVGVVK